MADLKLISAEVRAIYKAFDERSAREGKFATDGSEIACRKGCSYCCHLEVAVSAAEAYTIKTFLETERRPILERIKTRLRHARRQLGDKFYAERKAARVMCPLLNAEGACEIYEVRPLACRKFVSFDVERCKQDWERPGEGVDVPRSGTLVELESKMLTPLLEVHRRTGIAPNSYELIRALYSLFGSERVELRGEPGASALMKALFPPPQSHEGS